MLIERELQELNQLDGIVAFPINNSNLFDIVAKIEGPKNSIWESGIFQVYLKFNEYYNEVPPAITFQTIPFHPNIDVTSGKPSIDFLDDEKKWRSGYTIKDILTTLQNLLANPMLDRALNIDAVFMLKGYPERYIKIAHESVLASQRIQKGLDPFDNLEFARMASKAVSENSHHKDPTTPIAYSTHTLSVSTALPILATETLKSEVQDKSDSKKSSKPVVTRKRISFEDYYRLWKGIATSKPNDDHENVYIKHDLEPSPANMAQHLGLPIKDLEIQMIKQLNEHKTLMYGKFKFKNEAVNKNLQRIHQMRDVYLQKLGSSSKTSESESAQDSDRGDVLRMINYENEVYCQYQGENEEEAEGESVDHGYSFEMTQSQLEMNNYKYKADNWENEVDDLVGWTQNLDQ